MRVTPWAWGSLKTSEPNSRRPRASTQHSLYFPAVLLSVTSLRDRKVMPVYELSLGFGWQTQMPPSLPIYSVKKWNGFWQGSANQPGKPEKAFLSYYKPPEPPRSEGNEYGNPIWGIYCLSSFCGCLQKRGKIGILVRISKWIYKQSFTLLPTYQGPEISGFVVSNADPSAYICMSMGL